MCWQLTVIVHGLLVVWVISYHISLCSVDKFTLHPALDRASLFWHHRHHRHHHHHHHHHQRYVVCFCSIQKVLVYRRRQEHQRPVHHVDVVIVVQQWQHECRDVCSLSYSHLTTLTFIVVLCCVVLSSLASSRGVSCGDNSPLNSVLRWAIITIDVCGVDFTVGSWWKWRETGPGKGKGRRGSLWPALSPQSLTPNLWTVVTLLWVSQDQLYPPTPYPQPLNCGDVTVSRVWVHWLWRCELCGQCVTFAERFRWAVLLSGNKALSAN